MSAAWFGSPPIAQPATMAGDIFTAQTAPLGDCSCIWKERSFPKRRGKLKTPQEAAECNVSLLMKEGGGRLGSQEQQMSMAKCLWSKCQ